MEHHHQQQNKLYRGQQIQWAFHKCRIQISREIRRRHQHLAGKPIIGNLRKIEPWKFLLDIKF